MKMLLKDNADPQGRTVEVETVEGSGFLEIRAKGYGEKAALPEHGSVLALEVYNGALRVLIFGDINVEGPQIVSLEGAREDNRRE